MRKNFRAVQVSLILGMFLFSSIAMLPGVTEKEAKAALLAQRPKLFSFNSYIDIEYDPTPLNENLNIDESVNVPLTVKYWTDAPENFLQFVPWQIRNLFLFGSIIGPMQKLHLEIVDKPDWANIYISQPDILSNIPLGGQESAVEVTTSLILSPRVEAPSQSYSIAITATCDTIGRINGFEHEEFIDFTPSFVPTIQITPEEPTRTVSPRESVNFKITVKNDGNKKTRITPSLSDIDSKWTPTINPPFYDISPGGTGEFTFSIYTPYDFGWHNEIESFQIDFTAQIFPLREDAPVGGPYSIFLRVNNYGFSTPGFEIITLFAAIIIVGIILKKKHSTK